MKATRIWFEDLTCLMAAAASCLPSLESRSAASHTDTMRSFDILGKTEKYIVISSRGQCSGMGIGIYFLKK